jgi:hypothetical protein
VVGQNEVGGGVMGGFQLLHDVISSWHRQHSKGRVLCVDRAKLLYAPGMPVRYHTRTQSGGYAQCWALLPAPTAGDAYLSVDQLLLALLGSSDVSAALQEAGTTRQQVEDAIKQVG